MQDRSTGADVAIADSTAPMVAMGKGADAPLAAASQPTAAAAEAAAAAAARLAASSRGVLGSGPVACGQPAVIFG